MLKLVQQHPPLIGCRMQRVEAAACTTVSFHLLLDETAACHTDSAFSTTYIEKPSSSWQSWIRDHCRSMLVSHRDRMSVEVMYQPYSSYFSYQRPPVPHAADALMSKVRTYLLAYVYFTS